MAGALAEAGIGHGDAIGILAGQPVDIAPSCQGTWMRGASVTMLHQPTPRTDLAVWAQDTETVIDMISGEGRHPRCAVRRAAKPLLEERGITVVTVAELNERTRRSIRSRRPNRDIALQQLTSGSTGSPKAVQITHENFYTNAYAMIDRIKFSIDDDVMISWLPAVPRHGDGRVPQRADAGRRGGREHHPDGLPPHAAAVGGADGKVQRHRHGRTQLRVLAARPRLAQAEDGAVDLSHRPVHVERRRARRPRHDDRARRGGRPLRPEPVRARTRLRDGRDHPRRLHPRSGSGPGARPRRPGPPRGDAAWRSRPSKPNARALATLGKMVPDLEGRVVDSDGQRAPDRAVSASSRSAARRSPPGYITVDGHKPAQDADGWLDTGDVGYFTEEGLVVVCGRVKDVIIMGGRNIYPTDIERAAGTRRRGAPRQRRGGPSRRRAEAGSLRGRGGDQRLSTTPKWSSASSTRSCTPCSPRSVCARATVAVLGPGSIPKTSSGKLRRGTSANLVG